MAKLNVRQTVRRARNVIKEKFIYGKNKNQTTCTNVS